MDKRPIIFWGVGFTTPVTGSSGPTRVAGRIETTLSPQPRDGDRGVETESTPKGSLGWTAAQAPPPGGPAPQWPHPGAPPPGPDPPEEVSTPPPPPPHAESLMDFTGTQWYAWWLTYEGTGFRWCLSPPLLDPQAGFRAVWSAVALPTGPFGTCPSTSLWPLRCSPSFAALPLPPLLGSLASGAAGVAAGLEPAGLPEEALVQPPDQRLQPRHVPRNPCGPRDPRDWLNPRWGGR